MSAEFTAPAGQYRLILYGGFTPTASLYPLDATPFSSPVGTMTLSPMQDLPVLEPGGVVEATENFAEVIVGETVLRPVGKVRAVWPTEEMRIFAERGVGLMNPETPGWHETWRDLPPESRLTLEQFETRSLRALRDWRWHIVTTLALIGAIIALWIWTRKPPHLYAIGAGGASSASTVAQGRRARRALKVLAAAHARENDAPAAMLMRLRWVAGYGHGPLLVASLRAPNVETESTLDLQVVGLPATPLPKDWEPVDVVGLGAAGLPAFIEWGATRLWTVGQVEPPKRRRFARRRKRQ